MRGRAGINTGGRAQALHLPRTAARRPGNTAALWCLVPGGAVQRRSVGAAAAARGPRGSRQLQAARWPGGGRPLPPSQKCGRMRHHFWNCRPRRPTPAAGQMSPLAGCASSGRESTWTSEQAGAKSCKMRRRFKPNIFAIAC